MNPLGIINLGFTIFFTNLVVFGVMFSNALMLVGTGLLVFNAKDGKKYLFAGLGLGALFALLSASQLHVVPTSFAAVRGLGILTFAESDFTRWLDVVMYWIRNLPGVIASVLIAIGMVLFLISKESGFKTLLKAGGVMLISMLVISGGLFGLIPSIFEIPARVL